MCYEHRWTLRIAWVSDIYRISGSTYWIIKWCVQTNVIVISFTTIAGLYSLNTLDQSWVHYGYIGTMNSLRRLKYLSHNLGVQRYSRISAIQTSFLYSYYQQLALNLRHNSKHRWKRYLSRNSFCYAQNTK
jgi:hypothetical protein